jgi:phosphoglycolate phosphatase-like HAD superfamily hydrolase
MERAFKEIFAVDDPFANLSSMGGRTDAWAMATVAKNHGIADHVSELARFRDLYLRYLPAELDKPDLRKGVMPGVRELLDALSTRQNVHLALLTGNFERGARAKLEYFDLWRYFRGGAFGDEALDRNVLVEEALASVVACGGPAFGPADTIIIGDTPLDVACAVAAGARSLAVATGRHGVEELHAVGANIVFEDLSDTAAVLRALRVAE